MHRRVSCWSSDQLTASPPTNSDGGAAEKVALLYVLVERGLSNQSAEDKQCESCHIAASVNR